MSQSNSQPTVSQPIVSQPTVSQPTVSQPTVSQPNVSQPNVSQPNVSQPNPQVQDLPGSTSALQNIYDTSAEYGKFMSKVVAVIMTMIGIILIIVGIIMIIKNRNLVVRESKILEKSCDLVKAQRKCLYKIEMIDDNSQYDIETDTDQYQIDSISNVLFNTNDNKVQNFEGRHNFYVGWSMIATAIFIMIIAWIGVYINSTFKFAASSTAFSSVINSFGQPRISRPYFF
jgi:hypothetical protein